MIRLALTVALVAPALAPICLACTPAKNADETGGSATTSASESSGAGATEPTGGAAGLCPGNPLFSCTMPFNCTDFPCGALQDRFDADGCPRPGCGADEPCGEGQVCYHAGAWGECHASGLSCADADGACRCDQSLDCRDISYCVPTELGPPTDCSAITDAPACLAAGCDEAAMAIPITFVDGACVCGEAQVTCLWFKGEKTDAPNATPLFRKSTLEVVLMPQDWLEVPHGWQRCDAQSAPEACGCASDCSF